MIDKIGFYLKKPHIYAESTNKFWDDTHISKEMLKAHLTPDHDGATRNHAFVQVSVDWIAGQYPPKTYGHLLDLGCGPGIYAERFTRKGYDVTGIDFSKRSIEFAMTQAYEKTLAIRYNYQSYLAMNYDGQFDLATLIWCDYGALSCECRMLLLKNVYEALRVGGVFIFDVFTDKKFDSLEENCSYEYSPLGGFWHEDAYLCLNTSYLYEGKTAVRQAVVVTQTTVDCYNIWEHYFSRQELEHELRLAGFAVEHWYGDIAGAQYSSESETVCVVARK